MKKLLSVLVFLGFSTVLLGQDKLPQAPNELDSKGNKHGDWVWELQEGAPKSIAEAAYRAGQFRHGKPVGTFIDFDQQGKKLLEAKFLNAEENRIDGTQTWFSESGKIIGLVSYTPDGLSPDIDESLKQIRKIYKPEEPTYLECLKTLSLWTSGHPKEVSIQEEVVSLLRKKEGENSPGLSEELILLGWMYMNKEQAEKALQLFQQGAAILAESKGEKDPEYLKALTFIASAYERMGRLEEAENTYWQLANLWKESDNNTSFEYANLLADLALLYARQQKFNEATRLFRKVMGLVPKDSEVYEKCLFGLGSISEIVGDNEAALASFEQVLQMNRSREPLTVGFVWALRDVARLQAMTGKVEEAQNHLLEARDFTASLTGKGKLEYFKSLEDLALLYEQKAELDEAEKLWQEILSGKKAHFGENTPETMKTRSDLIEFYLQTNQPDKAVSVARIMVESSEALYGKNANETAQYLDQLGNLLQRTGRLSEAKQAFSNGLQIIRKSQGEEHTDQSNLLLGLGLIELQEGNWESAEAHFRKLYSINKKRFGTSHERTKSSASYLLNLYDISEQAEKAAAFKKEAGI